MHRAAVTTTESLVVEPNPRRVTITIQNLDASNYVDIADKSGGQGIRIYAGASASWIRKYGDKPEGAFYATGEASLTIAIYEEFAGPQTPIETPRGKTRRSTGTFSEPRGTTPAGRGTYPRVQPKPGPL